MCVCGWGGGQVLVRGKRDSNVINVPEESQVTKPPWNHGLDKNRTGHGKSDHERLF